MTTIHLGSSTATAQFGKGPAAFDPKYYLAKNADVARQLSTLQGTEKDLAALRHFIGHGAAEGRNPSAQFDVKAYLNAYPDIARSGVNPLLHYRNHGQAEGRQAFPVQEGLGSSRAIHVVPAADLAVFDLTTPRRVGPVMFHASPAFQVDAAAGGHPAASGLGPVAGTEVWAHGTALMQLPMAQLTASAGFAWPSPAAAAPAVIPHGAGAETLLPVLAGNQDAALLPEAR